MVLVSRGLGLCVLLLGASTFAQRVVILEIDHDAGGQLRAQLEGALERAGTVTLVPLQRFRDAAARRRLKGLSVNTGAAVARVSRRLKLDAAVGGEIVGGTYNVLIYNPAGQELWTKEVQLSHGQLSDELLARLARAIAAAGAQGAERSAGSREGEREREPLGEAEDEPSSQGAVEDLAASSGPDSSADSSADSSTRPDSDSDSNPGDRPATTLVTEVVVPGPPLLRGWVAGTTTWRSQCLRPGVSRCRDFDAATNTQLIIDFSPTVPYLGVALGLEVFPFARLSQLPIHRFLNGLGLVGSFRYGHSVTRIVEETAQGKGPVKDVDSTELGWSAELVYRVHFQMGLGAPQPVGFVGLHAGFQATAFTIDPTASTTLPSSRRLATLGFGFPTAGLDASIPVVPFFGVDLSGSVLINPRPAADVVLAFGNPDNPTGGVQSTGFSLEGGFSGKLIGTLGWVLHARFTFLVDRFSGQGQKWTCTGTCTGVGEETYTQVIWGLRALY